MRIVKTILRVLGILTGAYVLWMFFVALIPDMAVPKQRLDKATRLAQEKETERFGSRRDISFEVQGASLSAWLYLPEDLDAPVPCIIMGHGLGGTKDMGLEAYAVRFQEAGFAVLVFDYRYLGKSGGEPRQLVWIPYQLEDFAEAIAYARGFKEIDPARIALWGTSLSGGHVIVTAARDNQITCVSAQCPLLDGDAGGMALLKRVGIGHMLQMAFVHALRDLVRSWLGLSPHRVPLVGKPGSIAVMADSDAWNTFEQLAPDNFVNEVCARIVIRADKYHPINYAEDVVCPVLLQICDDDISTPMSVVAKAEERLGNLAEVIHYPIDHFDIYLGENFEKSVSDQLDFFRRHLILDERV